MTLSGRKPLADRKKAGIQAYFVKGKFKRGNKRTVRDGEQISPLRMMLEVGVKT